MRITNFKPVELYPVYCINLNKEVGFGTERGRCIELKRGIILMFSYHIGFMYNINILIVWEKRYFECQQLIQFFQCIWFVSVPIQGLWILQTSVFIITQHAVCHVLWDSYLVFFMLLCLWMLPNQGNRSFWLWMFYKYEVLIKKNSLLVELKFNLDNVCGT